MRTCISPQLTVKQGSLKPKSAADSSWAAGGIVALTLLAPALAGSTTLWAQGSISLATGLLFVLFPPRRSLGPLFNTIFIAIGGATLTGFLPANSFALPEWRNSLLKLGVDLPKTLSAQPWLTLQFICLLWLGLSWAYYLFSYEWKSALREKAWDAFCLGILCLAATLATTFALKTRVPFWPDVPEFGFFPNRNQTSNVLGLGGIMIYANAFQHLQRGQKQGWMWLVSLALICWTLILNYSRAGIILFFVGVLIWHVCWLITSRETAAKAIAWVPLAILFALLVATGGETLLRFKESADFFSASGNARFLIQRDAFELWKTSPVFGIGLGNFRSLFSAHRQFFAGASEAIHPESDWLWLTTEMGCLVSLFFLVAMGIWLRRCFPLQRGTWRSMRVAAMICGIGFALHGLLDVSGHRVGSLWPVLYLAGTATNPKREYPQSRAMPLIFRLLGVCLIGLGLWWHGSMIGIRTPPNSATLDRLAQQIESAATVEDYNEILRLTSAGLTIAPLNWTLYHERGRAEAMLSYPRSEASRDFAAARYLLPNWPDLWVKEGLNWALADEIDEAFETWAAMLRHFPDEAPRLFAGVYDLIKDHADLVDRWRLLGRENKKCLLVFFWNSSPVEFRVELDRLLADDPELKAFDAAEKLTLFEAWFRNGNKLELAEALREKSDWRAIGWKQLARIYADYRDYQNAYAMTREFAQIPPVPDPPAGLSTADLELQARLHPADIDTAAALCLALAKEGRAERALAGLQALHEVKGYPDYLRNLEAQLWERKVEWGKAWNALKPFVL
jgi:tetratricopeptide (TPR) repeat protein